MVTAAEPLAGDVKSSDPGFPRLETGRDIRQPGVGGI
jgi:hypothetical protein